MHKRQRDEAKALTLFRKITKDSVPNKCFEKGISGDTKSNYQVESNDLKDKLQLDLKYLDLLIESRKTFTTTALSVLNKAFEKKIL